MALTKQVVVDSIDVTEGGPINVRTLTRVVEDGVVISQAYHRHALAPGDSTVGEDARVIAIAATVWTDAVIAAYAASQAD
jgi:hypothetical protein